MKKEGKKWMLVVLALLAVVTVTLPLVGCKNDTVAEQTGDGTGSGSGNQGTGDGTGSGDGNQGTGGETEAGGGTGTGDPEQPVTYTVSFYTNGGGSIDSQPIVRGQTATKPADPTLENNVFGGWYSDEELTSEYDFTTPVTGSFTLYAKWVKRIQVTAYDVYNSVIAELTGDGSYILVATGEWSSVHLSAIKAALNEKPTAKVNLDLSKATGLTEIGGGAFYECRGLTSISIPSSVEFIGGGAFDGCTDLTSIDLSKATGLTTIEAGAFDGCRGLTSIDLSKATGLTTIRVGAFYGCSGLTSINIPEGVTTIGAWAFGGCSSLNIRVDENNTKYSSVNGMLLDKEKTILIAYPSAKGTVTVPTSVTTIGEYAFDGCSGLTSISIPSSVTSIGSLAFKGCDSLTSISIPEGVTTIGDGTFSGCSGLTSISIPSSVEIIGPFAFENCDSLTSISIPEGVKSIGYFAFQVCDSLTSISIPEGVKSIGDGAFSGCSGATVKVEAENPPTLGSLVFEDVSKILVPSGAVNTYMEAENWKEYSGKIEAIPDQTYQSSLKVR